MWVPEVLLLDNLLDRYMGRREVVEATVEIRLKGDLNHWEDWAGILLDFIEACIDVQAYPRYQVYV